MARNRSNRNNKGDVFTFYHSGILAIAVAFSQTLGNKGFHLNTGLAVPSLP
jgi:hypothetical protein